MSADPLRLLPGGWTSSSMSHDAYLTVEAWMRSETLTPRIVWRELSGRPPPGEIDWWDVGHLVDRMARRGDFKAPVARRPTTAKVAPAAAPDEHVRPATASAWPVHARFDTPGMQIGARRNNERKAA